MQIKRNNIADLIKFFAAIIVILAHSVNLSTNRQEIIEILTNNIVTLGAISVCIFFTYSGYFTYHSLLKKGERKFLIRRFKKLFPELLFVVMISIFVVGPLLTNLKIGDYFKNYRAYLYLVNSIFIPYHNLPGVFTNNICNSTVNGSLWTLPVEFVCYIFIYLVYKFLKKDKFESSGLLNYIAIIISIILIVIINNNYMNQNIIKLMYFALRLFIIFNISILIAKNNYRNVLTLVLSVILTCVFMCSKNFYLINISYCFLLPYIIIYLLKFNIKDSKLISFLGESSYCIYLVAYPIQQIVIQLYGGQMSWSINFGISLTLSVIIGCAITYLFKILRKKYKWLS